MNVVIKRAFQANERQFSANNVFDAIFWILNRILGYTKTSNSKKPTKFDHSHKLNHFNQDLQQTSSDDSSISTNSSFSSEDEHCFNLDKYDFEDFIVLCYKALGLNENLLILSMMYLDKILVNNFVVSEENIHKAFFLCMMEAQKFYDDENFSNKDYAKLCGISSEELLELELEFMDYMEYDLNISDDKYFKYKNRLQKVFDTNILIPNKYIEEEEK